jgi:RNA-directed DNA polymerase
LIKPSRDAVKRIRKRLADEIRSQRGSNAMALIAKLNPIIRGWTAYYREWYPATCSQRWINICGG